MLYWRILYHGTVLCCLVSYLFVSGFTGNNNKSESSTENERFKRFMRGEYNCTTFYSADCNMGDNLEEDLFSDRGQIFAGI